MFQQHVGLNLRTEHHQKSLQSTKAEQQDRGDEHWKVSFVSEVKKTIAFLSVH